MKSTVLLVLSLFTMQTCIAYSDTEMYDRTNLWYGSETDFDEVWTGIMQSMSSPSNVVMEYHAFQATNRIPVLSEVMASNRVYAISRGLNPSVITWSDAEYRSLATPPPLEEGEAPGRQKARHVMALMGVSHGDEMAICESWMMPTNVILEGKSYSVVTDEFDYVHVTSPTNSIEFARGRLLYFANGKEARIGGFMERVATTPLTAITSALNTSVTNLDPATNMVFLCSKDGRPSTHDVLIYKNLVLRLYAPTNAVGFAAAIINAGLPEGERITLPFAP